RVAPLPPVDKAPRLQLGTPITLAEGKGLLPFTLPPRLAHPKAVYTRDGTVNLLYLRDGKPRAVLTVFREGRGILDKLVDTTSKVGRVRCNGTPGLTLADVPVLGIVRG